MNAGLILLLIIAAVAVYFIAIYNGFVSLKARIDAAWSDIDVQLKRRHDLIPALVKTVKGYKEYEKSTLDEIVKARTMGMQAQDIKAKEQAETMLSRSLGKLFALAENYPDLKANTTFLKLQDELSNIEEALQNARRYYNAVVRDYNAKIESFPDLIIARKFHFTPREYFELEDEKAKEMPEIDL
jgi:LemA protein